MQAKQEMEAIKKLNEKVAGIIETVTNANGTAIKFADGTMICTLNITVTDQAINRSYESLYWGSRTWSFPVVFIEKPAVSCGMFKWGAGISWGNVSAVTETSATLVGMDNVSREAGTSVNISATAIGRWK